MHVYGEYFLPENISLYERDTAVNTRSTFLHTRNRNRFWFCGTIVVKSQTVVETMTHRHLSLPKKNMLFSCERCFSAWTHCGVRIRQTSSLSTLRTVRRIQINEKLVHCTVCHQIGRFKTFRSISLSFSSHWPRNRCTAFWLRQWWAREGHSYSMHMNF